MKNETAGIIVPISKKDMTELTKETKETIATGIIQRAHEHRSFSAVDLWNARRHQRTMASMRKCN